MLDIKWLRSEVEAVTAELKTRGFIFNRDQFELLETQRKAIQVETQNLQAKRNSHSKEIGIAKAKGENADNLMQEMKNINQDLIKNEKKLEKIQQDLNKLLWLVPNIPHESVPMGVSSEENQEIKRVGEPRVFDFEPKDHVALGEGLAGMDFEVAAKISGARFVVLYGELAKLHRALIQFMLDTHTQLHGYEEVYVPYLVNQASLFGTGQWPNFNDELLFYTQSEPNYALIPTAEVPVTNLVRGCKFESQQLPKKWVCHTPCFRREAGAAGKDTRGMIRQHQFEKVELVQIVSPEKSYEAHEELTHHAEVILQKLNLPYRRMLLCRGDLGFASAKTYDLEVWLPSQKQYREISSCSNFESFQARRMETRVKSASGKPEFVHTINGSGLAIGRTLVAILENYQDQSGNVEIPEILQPYLNGQKKINKKN